MVANAFQVVAEEIASQITGISCRNNVCPSWGRIRHIDIQLIKKNDPLSAIPVRIALMEALKQAGVRTGSIWWQVDTENLKIGAQIEHAAIVDEMHEAIRTAMKPVSPQPAGCTQ